MPSIFALSTVPGRAGVAVVRISGPHAAGALETLSGKPCPKPREAVLRTLRDQAGEWLDQALCLYFKGPASFTGEDVVELHLHGSRAVVKAVLHCLGDLDGLRPAEPGEFSRRAFANQKLDLTEAEGLIDLIDSETEAQRRQALRQMSGGLREIYDAWREQLIGALAYAEADIDFVDEEIPAELDQAVVAKVRDLRHTIEAHLGDARRGERLRDGVTLAIIGPPNAGKSTLLNRLAQRDVAIVSNTAGTTRDVVEVHLDLGGVPVIVADTAGIRETDCDIEAQGIARAQLRAEQADLKLLVVDAGAIDDLDQKALRLVDPQTMVLINKLDTVESQPVLPESLESLARYAVSLKEGGGLKPFLDDVAERVADLAGLCDTAVPTRERHVIALKECIGHLERFEQGHLPELRAEDLRLAARALGRITGRVDVEDILDVVFSDFCIGK